MTDAPRSSFSVAMRFPIMPFLGTVLLLICRIAAGQEPAVPVYRGALSLVRYDMPGGLSDGYAPTRQLAVRNRDAADATDWPDFTLNRKPIFAASATEQASLRLHRGADAASPFQSATDDVIHPGNHWLRAIEWRGGRRPIHIYTADKTARTSNGSQDQHEQYELWTFPLRLSSEGAPAVKNVVVKYGGAVVYKRSGPWRSLTLLLPASEPGRRYELTVDGRGPVEFNMGLMPVKLGTPREQLFEFESTLPGEPKIKVKTLRRPETFPNRKEWDADLASLGDPLGSATPAVPFDAAPRRWWGRQVPRSPLTTYAMALPHGMSGGFPGKGSRAFAGSSKEFADAVAKLGFGTIFDQVNTIPAGDRPDSIEANAALFAQRGIRLGLQYDNTWNRPALQHPNLPLFAHTLPEWHAPLYRSLSLAAQRFRHLDNFAGISVGADSAGYVSHWHRMPPLPDRPWGEAMMELSATPQPKVPRMASFGSRELPFEVPAASTSEFIKYVTRQETAFQQYGYFAEALREVDPGLVFTAASFGSAPGAGGRGGWPSGSIPGRLMFEGVPVQQAYDWNQAHSAKPLHLVSLVDRLRSYNPRKKTWALLDNFRLLYGRGPFQRAVAMTLTRGVQGMGTNFLPNAADSGNGLEAAAYLAEMNTWAHRYGGVFARTEPLPTIGIFYGHHQAVQRPVLTGENPTEEKLLQGSHEGKVAEALFLCHAAGWPARVITYQELMRGSLPASMRAVLLVGLNQADPTWSWGPGLEEPLKQFIASGGRVLVDDESVSPVPARTTGIRMASYVAQGNVDPTPRLFDRNAENIQTLRSEMRDVAQPIAWSEDPTLWAIPASCGDVQYVTAVNQAGAPERERAEMLRPSDPKAAKPEVWKTKANASLYVPPRTAQLTWNTDRPIYDVRLGREISREEAATVNLHEDAFQWYALPPAEITVPELTVQTETRPGLNTFYEAIVTVRNGKPIRGVPVRLVVSGGSGNAEVFGATGWPVRLPVTLGDEGEWMVTATELLSGLSTSMSLRVPGRPKSNPTPPAVAISDPGALDRFAKRKHVALTIGLTPAQEADPILLNQARELERFYRGRGRITTIGRVDAGGIVESLQPLRSPNRYPQWKTIPSDLVLFGRPAENVLVKDQVRARIFVPGSYEPPPQSAAILYARSPFVGEYDAVSICAPDPQGIISGVKAILTGNKAK